MKQKLKGSSYENINVKKLGAILIYVICCGQRDKPQQLSGLFAAVISITAAIEGLFAAVTSITPVINLAIDYLLRLGTKTATINGFFFLFFFLFVVAYIQ